MPNTIGAHFLSTVNKGGNERGSALFFLSIVNKTQGRK